MSWRCWVWSIRCRRWWVRIHCLSLQIHYSSMQTRRDCWSPNRHACLNVDRMQTGRRLTGKFRRKDARNTTGRDRRWRRKKRPRSRREKREGHWGDWRRRARRESSRTVEGCRRVLEKRREETGWTWRPTKLAGHGQQGWVFGKRMVLRVSAEERHVVGVTKSRVGTGVLEVMGIDKNGTV